MPRRETPIVTNEIYHIYNRSIALQPIFKTNSDYYRFSNLVDYYRFINQPVRFSHLNRLPKDEKESLIKRMHKDKELNLEIYAFAFMPTHYHFLAKQLNDKGISDFIRLLQNSYAKYFNLKSNRNGSLFQHMFRIKRIQSEEQLLHIARYIHLNPLTNYVLKDEKELSDFQWTSFTDYITSKRRPFVNTTFIGNHYKSMETFGKFTLDQLNYQRELEQIKHLL